MPQPIDIAYVELRGQFKQWDAELKTQIGKSVKSATKQIDTITTSTNRNVSEATKSHKRMFGSLSSTAKGAYAAIAGAVVVDKAIGFAKSVIAQARESQKVTAQTAAVIKSTGGAANVSTKQVAELANAISRKTGIDHEQIQASANMLLTFKGLRNETGKGNDVFNQATKTVTDMSVALKEDGKSASIQLGKALNDPIKGITALSRVGVTFTAQQKEQIKTLVASGNTLGAQKIILRELNSEFGGSAAAQATAGDKMRATWNEVKDQIGTALLPALDSIETFIATKVLPAIIKLITYLQANWPAIMATIRSVTAPVIAIFESLAGFIERNRRVLVGLIPYVLAMVGVVKTITIATKVWAAAQALLNTVMALNPFVAIIVGIAALVAALIYGYRHSETFRNIVTGVFSAVKRAGVAVLHFFTKDIPAAFRTVLDFVKKWGPLMLTAVVPVVGIPLLIWQHWRLIKGYITRAFSGITTWLSKTGHNLISGFFDGVSHRWADVQHWFNLSQTRIVNFFRGALNWLVNRGRDLLSGLWNGISARWSQVYHWFSDMPGRIQRFFRGGDKWLVNTGRKILGGLGSGFSDGLSKLKGIFTSPLNWIIKNVINRFIGIINKLPGVNIHKVGTISSGGGRGGGGGGGGRRPLAQFAAGGKFGKGLATVGERGWELAESLPGGGVRFYPHNQSVEIAKSLGMKPPGFALGGIFGSVAHFARSALSEVTTPILNGAASAVRSVVGHIPGPDLFKDVARSLINSLVNYIKNQIGGRQSSAPSSGGSVSGPPSSRSAAVSIARQIAAQFGWSSGAEWSAFNALEMSEAGYNNLAQNPVSTAFGVGQFLNSTWGAYGAKTSNVRKQFLYMMEYIRDRFVDPIRAWSYHLAHNSYRTGAWNIPRDQIANVHAGEMVLPRTVASAVRSNTASGGSTIDYDRLVGLLAPAIGREVARNMMRVRFQADIDQNGLITLVARGMSMTASRGSLIHGSRQ